MNNKKAIAIAMSGLILTSNLFTSTSLAVCKSNEKEEVVREI